jgi:pyruvate,water dikinase
MRAREEWRYDSMRAYAIVRERLVALAEQAVARGQLPSIDALWLLDMAEAARLDEGERFSAEFFTARRQEIAEQAAIDVPDLVYRFDDLTAATVLDDADTVDALRGVSLTAGEVHGRAWVLREPAHQLPPGFDPHTTILVARSVDAGWIATFGQVAGAVIEIGGDLSHGSIILREIGLPAITNVRLATRHIATGDPLTLIAGRGVVRKTAPASA